MCGTCGGGWIDDGSDGNAEAAASGVGRRGLLRGAVGGTAAGVGLALGAPGSASAVQSTGVRGGTGASAGEWAPRRGDGGPVSLRGDGGPVPRRGDGRPVSLRWLGVAGWELAFDGHHLLVDPYLSRQKYRVAGGTAIDAKRPLAPKPGTVEHVVTRHLSTPPDLVLVTHGHFDHLLDVPHLLDRPAWREHPIRTLCGETSWHLLRGMGTSSGRTDQCVVLSGGEVLRFPAGPTEAAPA